jgi:protocatechuate 3,4-dioxygenase beta subunit
MRGRTFAIVVAAVVALIGGFIAFEWRMWHPPASEPSRSADTAGSSSAVSSSSWFSAPPDQPETDKPHARIAGRVLNPAGGAIPDAAVCLWPEGSMRGTTPPPTCATTGPSGAYEIASAPAGVVFKLGATAAGHAPATYSKKGEARITLSDGEARDGVDIVLGAGGVALRGHVKDMLGGDVPGAAIVVSFGDDHAPLQTASDTKGEFIAWVPPGFARVTATAPGYTEGVASGYAPEHRFDVALLPGSAIVGRAITRPGGEPVANAEIDAIAIDQHGKKSVRSAEDGSFRIEGLSPGKYRLEGLAPGLSGYAKMPVLVGLAETSNETIVELDKSPQVNARVLETGSHTPCTGGEVTLHDKRIGEFAMGTIEQDGNVHFVAVLPGTYEVDVSCDDHLSKEKYDTVKIADKALGGIVWEVDRGSEVRGMVVDANGFAVANAVVRTDTESGTTHTSTRTDAQGAFVMRGVAPGRYDIVASSAESGTEEHESVEVTARHDATGVRVQLGRGARITGTVVDADGKPVAGAFVNVSGPTFEQAGTKEDGTFVAKGLRAGNYSVNVVADTQRLRFIGPSGEETTDSTTISITAAEEVKRTLTVERRAGFIEGRVVDARGAPLPDFFVDAQRINNKGRGRRGMTVGASATRVVTDTTGRFRIEKLADGEYNVRAFRQSGAQGFVERVAVGSTDVRVQVTAGAIIGTVTGADGARPDRFTVHFSNGKRGGIYRNENVFHSDGGFALAELPPGTYEVSIEAPEGEGTATAVVKEGETATIAVKLTAKQPEPEE